MQQTTAGSIHKTTNYSQVPSQHKLQAGSIQYSKVQVGYIHYNKLQVVPSTKPQTTGRFHHNTKYRWFRSIQQTTDGFHPIQQATRELHPLQQTTGGSIHKATNYRQVPSQHKLPEGAI
ncbi:hypothetical protein FQA47_006417 [Oryzias melastigma]|uniref:Uncharacterized protein n=1 Tax=Oryzias melastigma TaxID=30732 RepID=A0A834F9C2_ORYME|nr:hypothetical protein FQA47_006417 [Oryzias melastigma]